MNALTMPAPAPKWRIQAHAQPYGIAVNAYNSKLNFPADLAAEDKEELMHLARAFGHVLRAPIVSAPRHSFADWAHEITRVYDAGEPRTFAAVARLRRLHARCAPAAAGF